MALEQFVNGVTTSLSGSILNIDTTLSVASASGFPTSGNFRILIDTEIMLVTAVSGTTFTITRAADNTSAAAHSSGATVFPLITAGALQAFRSNTFTSDVIANIPAAGHKGCLYFPTDLPIMLVDNGTSWDSWLCEPLYKLTPPPTTSWTWVNQSTASFTANTYNLILSTNSSSYSFITRSYPATPWTIDIVLLVNYIPFTSSNFVYSFVYMDNTNKFVDYEVLADTAANTWGWFGQTTGNKFNSPSSFNAAYFGRRGINIGHTKFLRFADDGTNRSWSVSADGQNYVQIHNVGRTDFVTPTLVGLGISTGSSVVESVNMLSWYQH